MITVLLKICVMYKKQKMNKQDILDELSEIREKLNSIKSDLSPLIQKQEEESSIFLITKIKTILTKVCDKLSQLEGNINANEITNG